MKKNILVMEDDEDIRNLVGYILESEGYEVHGCGCSVDGLPDGHPDLILLDEWVNSKEGFMLCKEIKTIERLARVPVIIFSTAMEIEEIAKTCEADGYVHKPFDLELLLSEIKRLLPLDHRQAHRA